LDSIGFFNQKSNEEKKKSQKSQELVIFLNKFFFSR